jgi:hypothetical protein
MSRVESSRVESSPSGTENNDQRGAGAAVVKLPEAVEGRSRLGLAASKLWKGILYGAD